MNLVASIFGVGKKNPDKTAIFWGDRQWSYREVIQNTREMEGRLRRELGDQRDMRVAILLRNRPEFVSTLLGIFLADGVAVPINHFLKPHEIRHILLDAEVKVVVTESTMREVMEEVAAEVPGLQVVDVDAMGDDSETIYDGLPHRGAGDLALVIYTSGTTGRPKGAMLSHTNLLHNISSCIKELSVIDHDRFVVLLPMFHSFMITVGILLPLCRGGSIVLIKSVHPPKNILAEIQHHKATILPAIPSFFRTMLHATIPADSSLRLCVSGAAPMPVEVLNQFNRKFSVPLIEGYGLSEASPVVALNPIHGKKKPGSIGLPIHEVHVTIQDEMGNWLPRGEVGELCVRGGNVMRGYLNQPEATADVLRRGWLLTGDMGYMDEEGYIFITDRKKDMLLVNGINVYPREIEEVIYQYPGIREAAVVGRSDRRKGDLPIAFIVPETEKEVEMGRLREFLKSRLADYKLPREFHVIDALPRNASGKVLKTNLRHRLESQSPSPNQPNQPV